MRKGTKVKRISGLDVEFLEELRGEKLIPVEVTNGVNMYRPRMTDDEITLMNEARRARANSIANILLNSDHKDLSKYHITVTLQHKKKRYTETFTSMK